MIAITLEEMRASEASALANGWTEEQLLKLAGERLARAIGRFFPTAGTVIGYLGKGHNAGDTLVALRILRDQYGWKIATRTAFPHSEFAPLTAKKWAELGILRPLDRPPSWQDLQGPILLLDGLLGCGGHGPLRKPIRDAAHEMMALKGQAGGRIAAIDLPSGTHPDTGESQAEAVMADVTFMIGNAKVGLLKSNAVNHTGALVLVPLEPLTSSGAGKISAITPQTASYGKTSRPFDFHKGMAGRVAIYAGSKDYPGAAALAAIGALRGGAGLIHLFVPPACLEFVSPKCPPEIIVRALGNPLDLLNFRFDSLVIGCGLSDLEENTEDQLLELIQKSLMPTVLDAEALNLIARRDAMGLLNANHLLTPHPGEFARLAPDLAAMSREDAARHFTARHLATLLLKGSRTLVSSPVEPLRCNTTGNPGMASGGQGDLLAGVIGARLAIQDSLADAAALAAWLCGRAAEICLAVRNESEESLTASDVSRHLGAAFSDWKTQQR